MFSRYRFALPVACLAFCLSMLGAARTHAQSEDDPPSRVARFALGEGAVSFRPGGTSDWVDPGVNRPMTVGDEVWSDRDSRAELQLDGSQLRLGGETSVTFLNLDDRITQVQLSSGSLIVRVHRLDDDETYEIDTPNLAFSILRAGLYRISVDQSGNTTVTVRSGQGEATGGGEAYSIGARETSTFYGTSPLQEQEQAFASNLDDFDAWSSARDNRWERSESAHYVSRDVIGSEDLDDQGTWSDTPEYGSIWYPSGLEPGWAPYHVGHWAYIAPWGYTWVDARPWGFAPFHYGRWITVRGRWGWVPAPPRRVGAVYIRPVYAPALVAWVGSGAAVGWFALGPREVYVPSYPVSRGYLHNINISNTRVNTTVINNVYNTTIVNNTTVNNITYVNRRVPGAVAATSQQSFEAGEFLSHNRGRIDARAMANAPVRPIAPAFVPTRQAVLGPRGESRVRPPATLENRVATVRTPPPPRAPSFEQRQVAIRDNGGKPLSAEQVRRLQPQAAPPANVRVIAPINTLVTPPRAGPQGQPERPQAQIGSSPAGQVIHPNQLPQGVRAAPAATANSVLERQQLQEQQRLQAQQDAERLRMQQQQERDHQQLSQRADRSRVPPPGQLQDRSRDPQQPADQQRLQQQQAAQQAEQQRAQQQQQAAQQVRDRQQQADQQRLQQQAAQQAEQQRAQQQQQAAQQVRERQQQADQQRLQQQQAVQQAEQERTQQQQAAQQQAAQQQRDRQQQMQQQSEQLRQQQQAAQQERDRQQQAQQLDRQRAQQMEAAQRERQQQLQQQQQAQQQRQLQQQAEQQRAQQAQIQERQRQVEQQHQQQTQALQEQQRAQQQVLQQRQQEQARQQQAQPRAPQRHPDTPPNDRH